MDEVEEIILAFEPRREPLLAFEPRLRPATEPPGPLPREGDTLALPPLRELSLPDGRNRSTLLMVSVVVFHRLACPRRGVRQV